MTRAAAIANTVLAVIIVCACAARGHQQTGREPTEEDAMGDKTTVETLIVDLERAALEQFGSGDVDGPLALCDEEISYFDPFVERRIDGREALTAHYEPARGKLQYTGFDLIDPLVQALGDTAILTYGLSTSGEPETPSQETRWKVTAVYHRFNDGWRVVHSHFALFADTTPRDFEFTSPPAELGRLEDALLRDLLALEHSAMERWRHGDPWGFWELSAPAVTYFDPETDGRLDGSEGLRQLYASVEGKIQYDVSEYHNPQVQAFGNVAVLTYHYRSADRRDDGSVSPGTRWNTTEVFAKMEGSWRIVHTHWSYARAGDQESAPAR